MQGGRGSDTYADETIKITLISLCSHTDAHPNFNREVRRSLTWHSSKSESALERFEPVAVDKLRLDGSLAMFAPEGDGCLKRAWREDAGRIHKAGTTLCDFCRAFGHSKAREKNYYFLFIIQKKIKANLYPPFPHAVRAFSQNSFAIRVKEYKIKRIGRSSKK